MTRRPARTFVWVLGGAGLVALMLGVLVTARTCAARKAVAAGRQAKSLAALRAASRSKALTPERANELAWTLNYAGITHAKRREYAQALTCFHEALAVARRFNLRERAEASYEDIGNVYDELGYPDSAAYYYERGRDLARLDTTGRSLTTLTLNRGAALIRGWGTRDSAEAALRQALERAHERGEQQSEMLAAHNFGVLFLERYKPDSAIPLFHRALGLALVRHDRESRRAALYNLARAFHLKSEWDSAYAYFRGLLELCQTPMYRREVRAIRRAMEGIRELVSDVDSADAAGQALVRPRPRTGR